MGNVTVVRMMDGIGYGDGAISYTALASHINDDSVIKKTEAQLASPDVLVEVAQDKSGEYIDDDGCGDGRPSKGLIAGNVSGLSSEQRPKAFGAGVMMQAAAMIGDGEAKGKSLQDVFRVAKKQLDDRGINYGSHIDDHAQGDKAGCGAIDNAPRVLETIVKYHDQIAQTLQSMGVESLYITSVLDNYRQYANQITGAKFSSKQVVDEIIESGKVVKELTGSHKEMYIILNYVPNMTVNQDFVRKISKGQSQAFAVDVWRLRSVADRAYPNSPAEQEVAFIGELVYTLGVAATLTAGDLPVYVARPV